MKYDEKFARRVEFENGEVKYQKLIDHIEGVSNLTEEFVSKFFTKNVGKILGMLHDLGKYSNEFQERIRGKNIKVDHSTAGAIVCDNLEKEFEERGKIEFLVFKLLKYAITGHHCGLLDYGDKYSEGTIVARLEKKDSICDFSDWKNEIDTESLKELEFDSKTRTLLRDIFSKNNNFSMQMLVRFLFSSLIDADRLDAQKFSEGEESILASKSTLNLNEMLDIFNEYMNKKQESSPKSKINGIRNSIFESCVKKSYGSRGFYSLCVPTGGGKTLSSLAFALNHGVRNGHDRIIYSIPFTSIIEQNAKVYSDIFGEENVLEHHCNFNFSNELGKDDNNSDTTNDKERKLKYKLATENWDMPLIVTTNVQLFESMYSSKTSSVRKLHNIFNSIIILDEAQVIPNEYLKPCIKALEELVKNYNCTVIICTATQPEFQKNGLISEEFHVTEIIDDTFNLFQSLKRVEGKFIGKQTIESICEKMDSHNQVLTIVNTKNYAKKIFESLKESEGNFHLSTNMYPNHRKQVISAIRERLKNGEECRVVSTQLIEAGVDIDFPVVFRSISGIDSIVQAAGRCNREGIRGNSFVYVFEPEDASCLGIGYLKLTSQIGNYVVNDVGDLLSLEAISKYFSELFYTTEDRIDSHDILIMINNLSVKCMEYKFESISRDFKFIDNEGVQIIIPHGEGRLLVDSLRNCNYGLRSILRRLNGFSINVPEHVVKKLIKGVHLDEVSDGIYVLKNLDMYDLKFGFDKDNLGNYDYIL